MEAKDGKLIPTGELDEPLGVRPTSEMIIGESFAKWVQSYRDLPPLINQWANVVRWRCVLDSFSVRRSFCGRKGIQRTRRGKKRFPEAVDRYCIEAMMQDRKALQAGTSHFLGQNFAKASEIKFLNQEGATEYAYTTSWGVSTRLIGGMIMTHADDDGLRLPPKVAPKHVVIIPVIPKQETRDAVFAKAYQREGGSSLAPRNGCTW